ncbi:MAG: carotenoid 1,2-hydratase [Nitrospirae bacterium]|nr:carotenoid 1,2-hydratase [Nitrospirota bacterium]
MSRVSLFRFPMILFVFFAMILCGQGIGQGKEFKQAAPGYVFHFPADHGSHDDYQMEWWYFTGHLLSKGGLKQGFELTFFRTGIQKDAIRQNPSGWRVENIYSAHFALSNESVRQFWFEEKMSRPALGRGGSEKGHLQVWIDNWQAKEEKGIFYLSAVAGSGKSKKKVELTLIPEKPAVVHGERGVSPKDRHSENHSHYYSLTRLKTSGVLTWDGAEARVEGVSWMDHEFGSALLLPGQAGWDWFSVQLNDRTELMLYQLRNRDKTPPFSFGTFIGKDGTATTLRQEDFEIKSTGKWPSPLGGFYPMGWEIAIPGKKLSLVLTPSFFNQELNVFGRSLRYWEGSVLVSGSSSGAGYVEMTGYGSPFPR